MCYFNVSIRRLSSISVFVFMLVFSLSFSVSVKAEQIVDNQTWTEILQRYVDHKGLVDYKGLIDNRESFDRYVSSIEKVSPDSNPELFSSPAQSLAYYLNAYNAQVVKGVLARGPEQESVWKGWISGLAFFVRMDIIIGGNNTNLKELEDDIIRARYKDPRVHAALNCASIGCPRLIREAYSAEKLEQQLDAAVSEFLNGEMYVRIDGEKKQVWLSKIFDWYEKDFLRYETRNGNTGKNKDRKLIDYVNRYRAADHQIPDDYDVKILKYDKRINHQS